MTMTIPETLVCIVAVGFVAGILAYILGYSHGVSETQKEAAKLGHGGYTTDGEVIAFHWKDKDPDDTERVLPKLERHGKHSTGER